MQRFTLQILEEKESRIVKRWRILIVPVEVIGYWYIFKHRVAQAEQYLPKQLTFATTQKYV